MQFVDDALEAACDLVVDSLKAMGALIAWLMWEMFGLLLLLGFLHLIGVL